MSRSVGIAVAAVVLSITLGVLVGLVIHTGMVQRASNGTPRSDPPVGTSPGGSAAAPGDATGLDAGPVTASVGGPIDGMTQDGPIARPGPTSASSTQAAPPPAGTPTTAPSTSTPETSTPASSTTASSTTQATGPATGTDSTTRGTTSRTRATSSAPSRPAATPHPGEDAAEGRCGTLGAKSADSSGTTLFCQRDQTDGSLRWRAVVDGGGCLNQTMTGTGADGRSYACTLGDNGLNHWRAA